MDWLEICHIRDGRGAKTEKQDGTFLPLTASMFKRNIYNWWHVYGKNIHGAEHSGHISLNRIYQNSQIYLVHVQRKLKLGIKKQSAF